MKSLRIAIIQHKPVHLNLEVSIKNALTYINEAAKQGAQLIVFGETWLSGYPSWIDHCPEIAIWNNEAVKEVFALMHANSPSVDGEEIKLICNAAKELKLLICLGFNERVINGPGNGTIFNSFIIINENGEIANHHRKLMPTFNEKLLYGHGDAAGLKTVETSWGRTGGLICWEHWMPLSRQVLHNENEIIHIALWPMVHEMLQVASRHYAFEGRCFVLACGLLMPEKDMPQNLSVDKKYAKPKNGFYINGGSCIIGPDGKFITQPVFDTEEIIIAEIDLREITKEKMTLDVTGHYNRDDVFEFILKK